jgi:hypothetical protein
VENIPHHQRPEKFTCPVHYFIPSISDTKKIEGKQNKSKKDVLFKRHALKDSTIPTVA